MSEKLIHGVPVSLVNAARVPKASQNECTALYINYKDCIVNVKVNGFKMLQGEYCEDERRDYILCQRPYEMRTSGLGAYILKNNDPAAFAALGVAPSLQRNFRPTPLTQARH